MRLVPDALFLPGNRKHGARMAERVSSIADIAEPLLAVDRPAGERAWIRQQGGDWLFVTKNTADTIFFRPIIPGPVSRGTSGSTSRTAAGSGTSLKGLWLMLDEMALRKPGFSEGYKVKLADGQDWTFPKPRIRFRPQIGPDGRVEVGGGPSFGPEYDEQLDVLYRVTEAEPIERLRVKFEMAVRLLQANYELAAGELAELLVLEPGDECSNECWDQLTSAIMGLAPKPSPAT